MGLLTEGSPLSWPETKALADHVRQHGIAQFLNLFHRLKERRGDHLRWGDEVEYILVRFDKETRTCQVLLKSAEVLDLLQKEERDHGEENLRTLWRPEYASYMVEGVPGRPYGHLMAHFNTVEANMRLRREEIQRLLGPNEMAITLAALPRLGCPNFTYPFTKPNPQTSVSRSLFFPDEAINGHPRFKTLTRNIRERRGEKVAINLPIFKDRNTPADWSEDLSLLGDVDGSSQRATKPGHVYMDAMGFGMGCSCLQMTFQGCCIEEARILYDQLTPLCPIVMALSASTPIMRGHLLDTDCRWAIISHSVDDRTAEERGLKPLKENKFVINKSRYDSIDSYISLLGEPYNDLDLVMNPEIYSQLRDGGIDHLLAQHYAHLFIRDPISLFSEKIHLDDDKDTDHFENIQSTNWQTMRFKPPPPNSTIGWRVEFRPTEVQLTDFENAAFVTFIVLMTRVILTLKLNFLIPVSKVDANMDTAMKRDALLTEKFYFRRGDAITTCSSPPEATEVCEPRKRSCSETEKAHHSPKSCFVAMTVNDIINGNDEFPGLVPLIQHYLHMVEADVDTVCTVTQYLRLIQRRAAGELITTAGWMREFVLSHPEYKGDSEVTPSIEYDLLTECARITKGESRPSNLLPDYNSKTTQELSKATLTGEQHLNDKRNSLKK